MELQLPIISQTKTLSLYDMTWKRRSGQGSCPDARAAHLLHVGPTSLRVLRPLPSRSVPARFLASAARIPSTPTHLEAGPAAATCATPDLLLQHLNETFTSYV
jgi:hypothetical protein